MDSEFTIYTALWTCVRQNGFYFRWLYFPKFDVFYIDLGKYKCPIKLV